MKKSLIALAVASVISGFSATADANLMAESSDAETSDASINVTSSVGIGAYFGHTASALNLTDVTASAQTIVLYHNNSKVIVGSSDIDNLSIASSNLGTSSYLILGQHNNSVVINAKNIAFTSDRSQEDTLAGSIRAISASGTKIYIGESKEQTDSISLEVKGKGAKYETYGIAAFYGVNTNIVDCTGGKCYQRDEGVSSSINLTAKNITVAVEGDGDVRAFARPE